MSTKLATVIADFETQLASAMAPGATSVTIQSATDDDGNALPNGQYFFALDGNNSQKEHIVCTLTGTSLSNIYSVSRQGVQTSGVVRSHRIGSSVSLTDFAHLRYINDLVSSATTFDHTVPLGYDGTASVTTANQFATKTYVDGVAIAGAPNASTTVKGIVQEATQAQMDAGTTSGSTGAELYPTPALIRSKQRSDYVASDTGSANAYAIAPSPAITAYAAGQTFTFKLANSNSGASTLAVNGLTATAIKKLNGSTALASGDIVAGQIVEVMYDGTNFQLLTPVAPAPVYLSAGAYPAGNASALTNITNLITADVTQTTVGGSSTAENTVYSFTVPGGSLGTAGVIKINSIINALEVVTAGQTATIRFKYGGTTLASLVSTGTAIIASLLLEAHLVATGATNAQDFEVVLTGGPASAGAIASIGHGTATVDSTVNQTFAITLQFSDSQANNAWIRRSLVAYKL